MGTSEQPQTMARNEDVTKVFETKGEVPNVVVGKPTTKQRITEVAKSKVFWSAVIGSTGYLLQQPHVSIPDAAMALGAILGAAGVKDQQTKTIVALGTVLAGIFVKPPRDFPPTR